MARRRKQVAEWDAGLASQQGSPMGSQLGGRLGGFFLAVSQAILGHDDAVSQAGYRLLYGGRLGPFGTRPTTMFGLRTRGMGAAMRGEPESRVVPANPGDLGHHRPPVELETP